MASPTLVSATPWGTPGDAMSWDPAISPDGGFVAFVSFAGDLVAEDPPRGVAQIYLRDVAAGRTDAVSLADGTDDVWADDDAQEPAVSADGRTVVFTVYADLTETGGPLGTQVFLRDLQTGRTELISAGFDGSPGDGVSCQPAISADGRFVAFVSTAANLVGPAREHRPRLALGQIYLRDRDTGRTSAISLGRDGAPADRSCTGPAISPDGTAVAFSSAAGNLTADRGGGDRIFLRDLVSETTRLVSQDPSRISGALDACHTPVVLAGGARVAFTARARGEAGLLFVHEVTTGKTRQIKGCKLAAISSDGSTVACTEGDGFYVLNSWDNFDPGPRAGTGVAVRRLATGQVRLVGPGGGNPSLSRDGSKVAYVTCGMKIDMMDTTAFGDVWIADTADERSG